MSGRVTTVRPAEREGTRATDISVSFFAPPPDMDSKGFRRSLIFEWCGDTRRLLAAIRDCIVGLTP